MAGRSYQEVVEKGIDTLLYFEKQMEKAKKRRPLRAKQKPKTGTLYAIRNKGIAIREAALRKVQIAMVYRKVTTGKVKRYVVAPYSYRYKKLKAGVRKLLFAYDMKDKHIKGFVLRNVRNVAITDRKFKPKWSIEF